MNIDNFKAIIKNKTPTLIQNKLVLFEEAEAVVNSYGQLAKPFQETLMKMPLPNIIEFALLSKTRGGFKDYMKDIEIRRSKPINEEPIIEPVGLVEEPIESPIAEIIPLISDPIIESAEPVEEPIESPTVKITPIIADSTTETPKKKTKPSQKISERKIEENSSEELFYTRLLNRMDKIVETVNRPLSVTVQTTESHVERLFEIEQSMLTNLNVLTEKIEHVASNSIDTQINLTEMIENQYQIINQFSDSQKRIVESQHEIAGVMGILLEKIAELSQAVPNINPIVNIPAPIVNMPAPIVNVPAPIVNVITESGRRLTTKHVERDQNGLISKVIEDIADEI
jgi:hypothetical protein